jgi:hypothetical protein
MSSAHTQNAARPCVAVVVGSSDASLLALSWGIETVQASHSRLAIICVMSKPQ